MHQSSLLHFAWWMLCVWSCVVCCVRVLLLDHQKTTKRKTIHAASSAIKKNGDLDSI
jgi:hypothetical protein